MSLNARNARMVELVALATVSEMYLEHSLLLVHGTGSNCWDSYNETKPLKQ